jgi:hypothetical protein
MLNFMTLEYAQMGSKLATTTQFFACIMLGLFFDPEDEDGTFLKNSDNLAPDFMPSHSRRQY